jgi:hypothetical protein
VSQRRDHAREDTPPAPYEPYETRQGNRGRIDRSNPRIASRARASCLALPARVAAALLAAQLTHGRLPSPFTARDVYRNEWNSRSPGSCRARSPASKSAGGCGRTRSGPPTAGGRACGSTPTRG